MTLSKTFYFNSTQGVRMQMIENAEYFCAKDVCDILGIKNGRDALNRVDEGDVVLTDTLTSGGMQKVSFVNEAGLYALIFQGRKEEARQFKKWVFKEVLPSIRKTGSYAVIEKPIINADFLLDIANQMKELEKVTQMQAIELRQKDEILQEQEEAISDRDKTIQEYIKVDRSLTMSDTAKKLHLHPRKFIEALRLARYIMHTNDAYQEYITAGYFQVI